MKLKELIEKVREIDEDAADYLEDQGKNLPNYACGGDHDDNNTIGNLFAWPFTPQGRDYWKNISEQLGE